MSQLRSDELKSTEYEIFILALSVLAIFNWVFYFTLANGDVLRVIIAVDLLLSAIFLVDFFYRLASASSRRHFFFRQMGWLDLIGSLPFPQAKIARLGRTIRVIVLLRQRGVRQVFREFIRNRAGSAVYIVGFLIVLVLEFGSAAVLAAEHGAPGASIATAREALWWSIVTMSTVGYGDYAPVTFSGQLIGIFVIIVGVALFGVITGFLANRFVGSPDADEPVPTEDDLAALLDEMRSLRAEHKRAYSELEARVEDISLLLRENK